MPTNTEQVIKYLRSIAPASATNEQISRETRVRPHQQVFQITQRLRQEGLILGEQRGGIWYFRAPQAVAAPEHPVEPIGTPEKLVAAGHQMTPARFERLARTMMSKHFRVALEPGQVPRVPKQWDCMSPDAQVVGDAKYLTLVGGHGTPPAKFSMIAEHVWLLEKSCARERFLVFGNDRRVPEQWLAKYGGLVTNVTFFYLSDLGQLSVLRAGEKRS